MEALKRLTLALTVALVGAACGDDSDSGTKGDLDGGFKATDGGADSAVRTIPTKIILPDGGPLPCSSTTKPSGDLCGGSSCQQTAADLKQTAKTGATCGATAEIADFCANDPTAGSVAVISKCAYSSPVLADVLATPPDYNKFATDIKTCAKPTLTNVSDGCLDCFVGSAQCTAERCTTQCLTAGDVCDACRIATGCIKQFYDCAGYADPLAPVEAAFGL